MSRKSPGHGKRLAPECAEIDERAGEDEGLPCHGQLSPFLRRLCSHVILMPGVAQDVRRTHPNPTHTLVNTHTHKCVCECVHTLLL